MKHLVILRHGAYIDCINTGDPETSVHEILSSDGKAQYEKLGEDIKKLTNNGSVYIITTPAQRGVEGAELLASRLNVALPPEKILFLWDASDIPREWEGKPVSGNDAYYYMGEMNPTKAHEKLEGIVNERADKADVLVIVSHKDLCPKFTAYYTKKYFGKAAYGSFNYGQGVHLDLETKNGHLLPLTYEK